MLDTNTHLLIVDDEPCNLEIISEYLETTKYQVSTAENGVIAWQMLQKNPLRYDVILLDIMMPEMSGMEVLSKIKQNPVLACCPVIFQTAKASRDEILRGMQAGAYYYLTKPFEEKILLSIVEAAVRERMQFRELLHELEQNNEMYRLMQSGCFNFQTLEEANFLASLVANICPEPEKAVMGISELLINAVEHGNLGISYQDKTQFNEQRNWSESVEKLLQDNQNSDKFVSVEFYRNEHVVKIIIKDQGKGFDWRPFMQMSVDRATDNHGRGIALAGLLSFSRIEYQGSGNEVHAYIDIA